MEVNFGTDVAEYSFDFDFAGSVCAVVTLIGTPVDFLLQIKAILAPDEDLDEAMGYQNAK